jgi:methyl-accepting chemotaxis protein
LDVVAGIGERDLLAMPNPINRSDLRALAAGAEAIRHGEFSYRVKLPEAEPYWEVAEFAETINATLGMLEHLSAEVTRISREVAEDGRLGGQARVPEAGGTWWRMLNEFNGASARITDQVRDMVQVSTKLTEGDGSRAVTAAGCGGEW